MSEPRTTRRGMLATAGLAAAAAAALVATAATESGDARLLALADDLADLHRQTEAATDAEMDRALGAYWAVADQIAELPATTPQGIRAKARVLRSVVWQLGPDEGGHIADHTEALIAAVLGEGAP